PKCPHRVLPLSAKCLSTKRLSAEHRLSAERRLFVAASAAPCCPASCQPTAILCGYRVLGKLRGQFPHDAVEPGLTLEADAGAIRQRQVAIFEPGVVGKAAEIAEYSGVGLRPTQAKAGGDRERHLVAAMREERRAREAV